MTKIGTISQRLHIYERLGRCYELLRRWGDAQKAYENLLATARKAGDQEAEWEALNRRSMLGTDFYSPPEVDEKTELYKGVRLRAEEEGEPHPGQDGSTSQDYDWSPELAVFRAEEALSLARELEREDLVAISVDALALINAWAGRWPEATEGVKEAVELYARQGDVTAEIFGLYSWCLALQLGRPREGVRYGRNALRIGREQENEFFVTINAYCAAVGLVDLGAYEEALEISLEGVTAARALGDAPNLLLALMLLGDSYRALWRLDEAREAYEEMADFVTFRQYRAVVYSKLCAVAALREEWTKAHELALAAARARDSVVLQFSDGLHRHHEVEALLRGADEALAHEELSRFGEHLGGSPRFRVAYLRARAVLKRWENKAAAAVEHLQEAEALAGEIGLPGELWQIRAALGELHEETGEEEEANRSFSLAAQGLRALAANIEDEGLREGFFRARQVYWVLEKDRPAGR